MWAGQVREGLSVALEQIAASDAIWVGIGDLETDLVSHDSRQMNFGRHRLLVVQEVDAGVCLVERQDLVDVRQAVHQWPVFCVEADVAVRVPAFQLAQHRRAHQRVPKAAISRKFDGLPIPRAIFKYVGIIQQASDWPGSPQEWPTDRHPD